MDHGSPRRNSVQIQLRRLMVAHGMSERMIDLDGVVEPIKSLIKKILGKDKEKKKKYTTG